METFNVKIQTTDDPRENPPTYKIRTVKEMFDILNSENVERFLTDFSIGIRTSVQMRELVGAISKGQGFEIPQDQLLDMQSFTWIDDHKAGVGFNKED